MTSPALTIHAASGTDAGAVAALLGELGYPVDAADLPVRFREVAASAGVALVAEGNLGTVGFVSVSRLAVVHASGPVAMITALVVAERARGRGVGRQLVAAATKWAQGRGCVRLLVTSGEQREGAHAFYAACGMLRTGRRFSMPLDAPDTP